MLFQPLLSKVLEERKAFRLRPAPPAGAAAEFNLLYRISLAFATLSENFQENFIKKGCRIMAGVRKTVLAK